MSEQIEIRATALRMSPYQEAVCENVRSGKGHTVIEAVAGSGKSTTLLIAMTYAPPGSKILFVAFNSSTAQNLKDKVPAGVDAKTSHGVGFGTVMWSWRKHFPRIELNPHRESDLLKSIEPLWSVEDRDAVLKLVSFAKAWVITDEDQLSRMADKYDVRPSMISSADMIVATRKVLLMSLQPSPSISYDDMVFIPVALKMKPKQYDIVFIDETQDQSRGQIELALMSLTERGRLIVCGDRKQGIYGFRGADSSSMERITKRLNATVLPLSVTYRCPRLVVEHVQPFVPQIEAAPGAIDGTVERCGFKEMSTQWKPGDFVLSRVNAPLVQLCLAAWKRDIPAAILGRDVGKVIRDLIDRYNGHTVNGLLAFVEEWREREVGRLTAAKKLDRIDAIEDRAETILALCEGAVELSTLRTRINKLFGEASGKGAVDPKTTLILSSTHKAKGLEAKRVWVLAPTYRQTSGDQEEVNLFYVAATRALEDLRLVNWPIKRDE